MNEFERLERRHIGALEIKRCVGPNLIRGLVVSVLFHSALISLPVVAQWIAPEKPGVVISGPGGPIIVLRPFAPERPWIAPRDLRPTPPKHPVDGKWVPTDQEPEPDSTLVKEPQAPVGGSGGGEGIGGAGNGEDSSGTIGGFVLPEDTIPPDTVFIAVEIDPQAIPEMCPWPEFPELAKIARLDGKVTVKVWVDRFGDVRKWKILQTSPPGLGFEDEVLKVIPRWKFTPAVQQGRAVGVWVAIPFKFVCKR
jgi:protein TonB